MHGRQLGKSGLEVSALGFGCMGAIELTAGDLQEIDRAAAQITVQGARYPEHLQRLVGR